MRSADTELQKHNRTTHNSIRNCTSKTGWMSTPKQKKDDFEALFKGFLKGKLLYQNCENLLTNHYRSLDAAAPIRFTMFSCKRNSITHAAAAPSNLDAATSMRSADTELQKHNRTTHNSIRNCTSKTGSRRQSRKKTILKHFLKGFLKGKLLYQNCENLLTNHYRSLDAAAPIRFTMFSCKRQ